MKRKSRLLSSGGSSLKRVSERGRLLTALYHHMFDKIGGCANYSKKTEYQVGVGRINEEAHCIFGSVMKSMQWKGHSEIPHIEEEIGLLEKDVNEYERDIGPYEALNDSGMVKNAKRVRDEVDMLELELKNVKPEDEKDVVNLEMARRSLGIMRRIADEIIENPNEKPFWHVRSEVRELREFFETRYVPVIGG